MIWTDRIPLGNLKALPNGKDADGNLWYKPNWESRTTAPCDDLSLPIAGAYPAYGGNCIKHQADINNKKYPGHNISDCAYEGYGLNSRRAPNIAAIPISKHVTGEAIDGSVDWDKLGGFWSSEADAVVQKFRLYRPFRPGGSQLCTVEPWHFELIGK